MQDTLNLLAGHFEHIALQPMRVWDYASFFVGKAIHYTAVLLLPVWWYGLWTGVLCVFLPLELIGGWFLATVFAVSHNTEANDYNVPQDKHGWAEMQVSEWSSARM